MIVLCPDSNSRGRLGRGLMEGSWSSFKIIDIHIPDSNSKGMMEDQSPDLR